MLNPVWTTTTVFEIYGDLILKKQYSTSESNAIWSGALHTDRAVYSAFDILDNKATKPICYKMIGPRTCHNIWTPNLLTNHI